MNKLKFVCTACAIACFTTSFAGGILTNTNQSVSFLRNPARDAAIGIDGVYSNPAGVVFMNNGLHLSFNWQYAHQTRTILTTNPDFALGMRNNNATTKEFEGVADAPVIPSLQAAYNKGRWSWQFNFAVTGGGGKCEFSDGIGSFESAVGAIANQLKPLGATGYDVEGYMRGKQYYFGFSLGAAYKLTDNLSVYGGARILYGSASYKARLSNIMVNTQNGAVPFGTFLDNANITIANGIGQYADGISRLQAGIAQYQAAGVAAPAELTTQLAAAEAAKAQLEGTQKTMQALETYREGVNLMSDQSGIGIAPILGIDYRIGNFNFAAKYEFKTRMRMENSSTVKEAHQIDAVNKYRDGSSVPEDQPALFTVGAQWEITPNVRVNAGYHLFFDKSAHWYNHDEKKLDGNTWEINGGAEWDINDKLQVSGGLQKTNYGLSDAYMNDMSFVVSSYTYGFGVGYKVSEKVKVNVAYFQTNYDTYKQDVTPALTNSTTHNEYTRTNRVFGVGVDLTL
ncbi:MAG: outer membrane beta-barrel protein [Prevotella sp.]|nr:outer membrane beta-barrel protein [Prevotella sp.]